MSLWFLFKVASALDYSLWDGEVHPVHYNEWLVTPPRLYEESISSIPAFFYLPGNDLLVAFIWFHTYHWPGWSHRRIEWHAETGAFIRAVDVGIWGSIYTSSATAGSYGSIYSARKNTLDIFEVDWETLAPRIWFWTPPAGALYAVVNREDDLAALAASWYLDIYTMSTSTKRGSLRLPTAISNGFLAWESRDLLWVITSTGLVLKGRYSNLPPRWELMSSVQNPSPDALGYLVAFDTKRNRLAVLRWRPDDTDGACRLEMEFYRPLVKVATDGLTDPVPVTPVRAREKARFVAHLHGEQGEGLGAYFINAELAAPATGDLLNQVGATLVHGEAAFAYQAPVEGAGEQDTLALSASIEQDGT